MQKLVNLIALGSGIVSLSVVGLGGYVYLRKDAIIEDVKSKVIESVLPSLPLPGLPGGAGAKGTGGLGGIELPKF
tara:strand:- start:11360 stop:11584 length:225 start_codon:yes stop_codon:yes gene_type:complete